MPRSPSGSSLPRSGSSTGSLSSKLSSGSLSSKLSSGSLSALGDLAEGGPAAPTAEDKQQAFARVGAAGAALAAALAQCGGDSSKPEAVYALEELKAAKAELKAMQARK